MQSRHVVIVGAGFGGLNAVKKLGNVLGVDVTVIDRSNHHLFQPLLYQVAMAGLSPADIAAPIRSLVSSFRNVRVLQGALLSVDLASSSLTTDFGNLTYDYLVLACGARHSYFGHNEWENNAPGLKTLADAFEIRPPAWEAAFDATLPDLLRYEFGAGAELSPAPTR